MDVNRSSFYKWRKRMANPSDKMIKRQHDISYHNQYPTHGYRWLNAKIALDLGVIYSVITTLKEFVNMQALKAYLRGLEFISPQIDSKSIPTFFLQIYQSLDHFKS